MVGTCRRLLEQQGGQGNREHRKTGQHFSWSFALHSGQGLLEPQQIPRECCSMLDVLSSLSVIFLWANRCNSVVISIQGSVQSGKYRVCCFFFSFKSELTVSFLIFFKHFFICLMCGDVQACSHHSALHTTAHFTPQHTCRSADKQQVSPFIPKRRFYWWKVNTALLGGRKGKCF